MTFASALLKKFIYIFNVLLFICGAVVLGLGIWSVVENVGIFTLLDEVMLSGVYILIVGGAVVMLISFLGCYGGFNESKPAIVVYCTITLLVAALKTVGCIILYIFYVQSFDFLANSYKTEYGMQPDSAATKSWDKTQSLGGCCGLLEFRDWQVSAYYNATRRFPTSCCVPSNQDASLPLNEEYCHIPIAGYIYETGCDYLLKTFYYAIGGTTIFVIICELAAIIVTAAFYQYIP